MYLLQPHAPPTHRLFQGMHCTPGAKWLLHGTAGGLGVEGVSPWPSNVASPRKTSRLCLPLRDELNEEEQSFEKGEQRYMQLFHQAEELRQSLLGY